MPSLLELEEDVFLQKDDSLQDYPHCVKDDKPRRFHASYIGCCDLQSGYTPTHLNYAIGQLADMSVCDTVALEVVSGNIIVYDQGGAEMFCHSLRYLQKLAVISSNKAGVFYVLKESKRDQGKNRVRSYKCFLFILQSMLQVPELFSVVQEEKAALPSSGAVLSSRPSQVSPLPSIPSKFSRSASLCGDSPPNFSQFFEVLFLGKIKSSHKRAPQTFIDDALRKFKIRESKLKEQAEDIKVNTTSHATDEAKATSPAICHPLNDINIGTDRVSPSKVQNDAKESNNANSAKNRTMLLQVGRTDLRLISPDTKQVLLHKSFREISHVARGQEEQVHFGFICKDGGQQVTGAGQPSQYMGYIFMCDSVSVVEDIMQGLRSAFQTAHEQNKKEKAELRCPACPIAWYDKLADEVNGLSVGKAQGVILKRLEESHEKENILSKMQGAETSDIAEQNQVLMLLLKASCEVQQESRQCCGAALETGGHGNIVSGGQDRTEVNMMEAVRSAKRSLAESFTGMMRRRASTDTVLAGDPPPGVTLTSPTPVKARPHPLSVTNAERQQMRRSSPEKGGASPNKKMDPLTPGKHGQYECSVSGGSPTRQRARTVGSAGGETMKRELARRRIALARLKEETEMDKEAEKETDPSPRMTIFKKTAINGGSPTSPVSSRSSRQLIFQKVSTPDRRHVGFQRVATSELESGPRDYKQLWQNAIKQQIILGRMEQENARRVQHEEQLAEKRLKLDYEDLKTGDTGAGERWEELLASGRGVTTEELRQGVSVGVPKARRGEVWSLLAERGGLRDLEAEWAERFPNLTSEYDSLKSQLTSHQHAILIDLGRTFPSHGYFSGALGPGQCGLFNLLKAYSILDPEVGYCQGLPFCVGLLLMHAEEEAAFSLLKSLMFSVGLRRQFHPDMTGLQVSLYSMTRLLAETRPGLYRHLDRLEADPSLYATPWFLTIFAAHFPLGFVSRVLDLVFLEGTAAALVKVAVCLLQEAGPQILAAHNLEELMMVMKEGLPSLPHSRLEDVISQAGSLNIARQLETYEVEFTVLQEEQSLNKSEVERLRSDLEAREAELREVRGELTGLRERLEVRERLNNNSSEAEDRVVRMVTALEQLRVEDISDEMRLKLGDIIKIGKES